MSVVWNNIFNSNKYVPPAKQRLLAGQDNHLRSEGFAVRFYSFQLPKVSKIHHSSPKNAPPIKNQFLFSKTVYYDAFVSLNTVKYEVYWFFKYSFSLLNNPSIEYS